MFVEGFHRDRQSLTIRLPLPVSVLQRGTRCHDRTRFAAHFCPTPGARLAVFVEYQKNAKDFTELMMKTKETRHESHGDSRREEAGLDSCYGKIGISAVAAALPYQSNAKNPAYAPAAPREDMWLQRGWFAELAAA